MEGSRRLIIAAGLPVHTILLDEVRDCSPALVSCYAVEKMVDSRVCSARVCYDQHSARG